MNIQEKIKEGTEIVIDFYRISKQVDKYLRSFLPPTDKTRER